MKTQMNDIWKDLTDMNHRRRTRLLETLPEEMYAPEDGLRLASEGKAACGQAALAAFLSRPVDGILEAFKTMKGLWVTESRMLLAIKILGLVPLQCADWPKSRAVVWLQGIGSWMNAGVPIGARNQRTHWIAQEEYGELIYDINIGEWVSREVWEATIGRQLLQLWKAKSIEPRSTITLKQERAFKK